MDKIIMAALQLYFLGFTLEVGVWSLAKVFWSSWDMPNPTYNNQQVPDQSSSIVYSDRAGHLAFYCSTLFGIVLGRHARMLATYLMLYQCATAGRDRDVGSDLHEKVMKKRKIMLYHQVNNSTLSARTLAK